ncbi:MAG TPA: electron transfer flavoprotein subunit alpha/FixB family protein [Clostridia bacterium]|nr:electron transfer flavoprotein subunit alpha/FixB family protein [Clostridia bacterium]
MGKVFVIVEHKKGALRKATHEVLGAGRRLANELGAELAAVIPGHNVKGLVDQVAAYGVDKIFVCDDEKLANYSTAAYTDVVGKVLLKEQPNYVFLSHTATGKDLAPRLAQRLEAGLASDCTAAKVENGELVLTKPIYAGKAFSTVKANGGALLVTFRPNALGSVAPEGSKNPEVVEVPVEISPDALRVIVKEVIEKATGRPELTEAEIIISGGRGMKGPENFKMLEEIADILGAAVGASRAAVDAGWREHSDQVGQTGKTVSPVLYIAVGISGAIQHLAGMGSSRYIVAINKDPEANIFKVADFGIVGDLFQVLPVLKDELQKVVSERPA